jgi:HAE1 family hydrophobic/amphiphilic exporter-1
MLRGAIQRPIAVSMVFAALALVGIISYRRLPVDLLPSITYPRLTVVTTYEDIPAEDLERLITQPLEEAVTALSGVHNVVSRTREGVSTITIEYEWGTEMDFANLHLRESIDRVAFRQTFPEQADRPVILRWDPTSRPVSILVLKGEERIEALTEFAQEVVKPALEQESGLSQAELIGGSEREILVEPIAQKLDIYGIQLQDIAVALARSNVATQGGRVRQGPLYLSLRIDGEFTNLDEIAATDIQRQGGSSIRISDVARVIDTIKEAEGATFLNGERCVALLIYKEPEANTIRVAEAVDRALLSVVEDYGEFDYSFVYRDADYVRESFRGLKQSLLVGGVLAILILFFFLRDFRSPLVVGLSIPISIIITFGLLYFGGVKLNLMSLGGLSLAAGMLVDNAIVVLENINRHLDMKRAEEGGDDPVVAPTKARRFVAACAAIGTAEVARPVIASTLTTIAVFFPVVYVPGIAGAFFRDQALAVTISLFVSVFVALILQPVLSARILAAKRGKLTGLFALSERFFEAFHLRYHALLERVLARPTPLFALLLVGLAGGAFWGMQLDRGLMPKRSSGDMRIDLELPSGTPLEETMEMAAGLSEWVKQDPDVKTAFVQAGRTETTLAAMKDYTAAHTARLRVILHPARDAYAKGLRIRRELAEKLQELEELSYAIQDEGVGLGEVLQSAGAEFQLGVLADDPLLALRSAEEIYESIVAIPGLHDLTVDRVLGTPNVVVQVNREEALRSGLDPEQLSNELSARVRGIEATTFNEIEQRIDIAVRFPYEERIQLAGALDAPIRLASGRSVPLRAFLKVEEHRPVRELVRHNQRRMVTVSGSVEGRRLDDVWVDVRASLARIGMPANVRVMEAGERQAIQQSFHDLSMAMVLAIVLVYMILAAQFESFLDPILISAVLPIGIAGSIVAMGMFGQSINILSLIGAVALIGIAVNDAIVKVDTIRRLRAGGARCMDAILEASRIRLRPILMTSVTTVLAMLPMAIGIGSGEQLQRPLAITIIGGLTITTAVTLFLTPALYLLAHRREEKGEPTC